MWQFIQLKDSRGVRKSRELREFNSEGSKRSAVGRGRGDGHQFSEVCGPSMLSDSCGFSELPELSELSEPSALSDLCKFSDFFGFCELSERVGFLIISASCSSRKTLERAEDIRER